MNKNLPIIMALAASIPVKAMTDTGILGTAEIPTTKILTAGIPAEETPTDTTKRYDLPTLEVVQTAKNMLGSDELLSPITSVSIRDIQQRGMKNPKALSAIVPGLHIPDYGSAMTASIYMRGFGSRIDNPVMGMYIDDVPVVDKNHYDFDFFDVRSIDVLRGPQSTLYGRNSMLGVLAIQTLSPTETPEGRVALEYGKANTVSARASYSMSKASISAGYRHSDGFFRNAFDGNKIDSHDALSVRAKYQTDIARNLSLQNTLSLSMLDQGGWAYQQQTATGLQPVDMNDDCSFRRMTLVDGLKLTLNTKRWNLTSVSSFHWLIDEMDLDNDFTRTNMFTMAQDQHQHAVTEELILRPNQHPSWWNHQTGAFFLYKNNTLEAPVALHQDALDQLILNPVNKIFQQLKQENPKMPALFNLAFSDPDIHIRDDFRLRTSDMALFHESYFTLGRWRLTAGLRLDYERNSMRYDCDASAGYVFSATPNLPMFGMPIEADVPTIYKGDLSKDYLQLLPKLSVAYDVFPANDQRNHLQLIANISKGFKAGGYNTQIFSDILREQLRANLINDVRERVPMAGGFMPALDGSATTSANTTYKPETCTNLEFTARYRHRTDRRLLSLALTAFLVNSNDMQITVMPDEHSTGRVMQNAGKARSVGLEFSGSYSQDGYTLSATCAFTRARFRRYLDGANDYRDKTVPYTPESSIDVRLSKQFVMPGSTRLTLAIDSRAIGRTWWNEANTLSQSPYVLFGADATLARGSWSLYGRADNLTDRRYHTFYFTSVGNEFYQTSKPFSYTLGCAYRF